MVVILLGLCTLFTVLMADEYGQTREQAARSVSNVAAALALDASRNTALLDMSLQAVAARWSNDEIRALKPSVRQQVLFGSSVSAEHFGPILVLNFYGDLVAASDGSTSLPGRYAEREEFKVHVRNDHLGLYVSKPFRNGANGPWSLAFSRRLANSDGGFAGIVTVTFRLAYLQDVYRRMRLGAGGLLTLVHSDGTLMAREPEADAKIGLPVPSAAVLAQAAQPGSGRVFEAKSVIDGISRLYASHQVGTLPLVQFVAMSRDEIYAKFWHRALVMSSILAVLGLGLAVLLAVAKREIDDRRRAEAKLQEMATTDELTGLLNRRAFNAVLERQQLPVHGAARATSLLMIDVDRFKAYNDTYGHVAGDRTLRQVAAAIAGVAGRHNGLACRYGGEEFAIILPGIHAIEALETADEVRHKVFSLRQAHASSECGIVTVSVGLSWVQAQDAVPGVALLEAADRELYRAKQAGRNRSCLAGEPLRTAA